MRTRWWNVTLEFGSSGWTITYTREAFANSREKAALEVGRRSDYPAHLGIPQAVRVVAQ